MKLSRSLLATTGALLWALSLLGCPAPTGRRRGPLDTDGGCSVSVRPVDGESCTNSGAVCDFTGPCEFRGRTSPDQVQTNRCSCSGGQWRCVQVEACFGVLPDGGVTCPDSTDPRMLTFTCGERHRGMTCALPLFQCPDGTRPPLSCTCDGSFWQCETVACPGISTDAGPLGRSRAGQPCESPDECVGLRCEQGVVAGNFCSGSCSNSASQAIEQQQCGGAGSTCIGTVAGDALCTQTCRPSSANPGCRPGFACTGLWFSQESGMPDAPGCVPFCASASDCPDGQPCNARTGRCGEPGNPMGLADGQPCNVDDPMACRGTCFRVTEAGTTGVCGSLIDTSRRRDCPDDPAQSPLGPTGDNLAICIFKPCSESQCCPTGLVCEGPDGAGFCVPDDPMEPNIACVGGADGGMIDGSRDR